MRIVGSTEVGGIEYQTIWASLSSLNVPDGGPGKALAVRDDGGKIETIIRRNARLADVEASLRHLRSLGLKDTQLSQLFNYKGDKSGLAPHIKMLVSRLNWYVVVEKLQPNAKNA